MEWNWREFCYKKRGRKDKNNNFVRTLKYEFKIIFFSYQKKSKNHFSFQCFYIGFCKINPFQSYLFIYLFLVWEF